jgi:hypothetical protein
MQISGEWYLGDDGIPRPVIRGLVKASDGLWKQVLFLVDTGADRTVFSAPVLAALRLSPVPTDQRIGGVGGLVESIDVQTTIRLRQVRGTAADFRGQFAAVTQTEVLDMSVLGRDITGLFAVIVDQPGDTVCLPGQRHRYAIHEG